MIYVYGASDDLIEVEGDTNEEFDHYDANGVITLSNGNLQMDVSIVYGYDGNWKLGIISDNTPWPIDKKPCGYRKTGSFGDWANAVTPLEHAPEYSEVIIVDAPEGTTATYRRVTT